MKKKQKKKTKKTQEKKKWKDVFENITYSGGPGDNIYVYG